MRDQCGASVGARDSLHWRGGVGLGERNSVKEFWLLGSVYGSLIKAPKSFILVGKR